MAEVRLKDAKDLEIIFPEKLGGKYAIEFDDTKFHHVNFGKTIDPGVDYGNFWFGFWIRILGGQYFWSPGNGGAHDFLIGVAGDAANGYTVSGNSYNANTSTATTFASEERLPHDCVVHVAGVGDTNKLGLLFNGVPTMFTSWSGVRRMASSFETIGFLGGSDHQHFKGYIYGMQRFEGNLPYANPFQTVIRPPLENLGLSETRNGSTNITPYMAYNFRKGTLDGMLNGKFHEPFFAETLSTGAAGFSDVFSFTPANNRVPANLPKWRYLPITSFGGIAPQKTQIALSRIYYDASGADKNYVTSGTLGGLVARIGNKTFSSANYGQQNGAMFCNQTSPGLNLVTDSATDGTIILRKPSTAFPTGIGAAYGLVVRATDANNFTKVVVDEYGQGFVQQYTAGVYTGHLGTISFGTGWTELKAVLTGSEIKVYNGATLKATQTMTANLSGTSKGIELNQPILRVSEFAVI